MRRRVVFIDRVVVVIDDVNVARTVHRHPGGVNRPQGNESGSRMRRGVVFFDRVVAGIGDVDVARPVYSDAKATVRVGTAL